MTYALVALLTKMAIVAGLVVIATRLAERARPAMAALIATLPMSIGPTLVILAIEHDVPFLTSATLKASASNGASMVFIAAYANALTRLSPLSALVVGYLAWGPAAALVHSVDWSAAGALAFVACAVGFCGVATHRFRGFLAGVSAARRWWDVPLRALCVAAFVGSLTGLSNILGPSGAGTLASAPVIMTSVGLITQLRMGGRTAAAVLSNTLEGMVGVSTGLLLVHLLLPSVGSSLALLCGLLYALTWNLGLYAWQRRSANRTKPANVR